MDSLEENRMKQILFLIQTNYSYEKRLYLQAKTLHREGYEVTIVAVKDYVLPDHEVQDGIPVYRILDHGFNDIKKPLWFRAQAKRLCSEFRFSVVHAHDQAMFHLGTHIKRLRPEVTLIYDSRELFHEWPINLNKGNDLLLWAKTFAVRKLEVFREKRNGKYIDRLITVNDSLAEILTRYFKLSYPALALRNFPERAEIPSNSNVLREIFPIPADHKIIVYFGHNIYLRSLNIEQVFAEFTDVQKVSFVIIAAHNAVGREVMQYVTSKGYKNIFFHDLILPEKIQYYLSSADVGLVSTWNKKDKSYWLALGNKLFDYLRAGIPLLATEQPEYKRIIDTYQCGVAVNPDQEGAYRRGFEKILENYSRFAENARMAGQELCWENEEKKLLDLYSSLHL
jgi:glycosyltransferase involved in cell wall biosynthesis